MSVDRSDVEPVKLSPDAEAVLEQMLGLHRTPDRHGMGNSWVSHSGSRTMPELLAAGFVYEGIPSGLSPVFHATLAGMLHKKMTPELIARATAKVRPARGEVMP